MILSLAVHAQQVHFIYIQADNKQPFSVELNGKYYSSSSIGYIILPKLTDSTYNIKINFAKNSYPEQSFTLIVAGKDYGYALKNFDDKGWGLFNFQTTDVVMNNNTTSTSLQNDQQPSTVTSGSAFGNMLADVINDKSINTLSAADTATSANETKSKSKGNKDTEFTASTSFTDTVVATLDTAANPTAKNDNTAKATDTLKEQVKEDPLSDSTSFNTSGVIKAEENVGEKGTDLTFVDFNGEHSDTIKAFIPAAGGKKSSAKATDTDTLNINAKADQVDSTKGKVNNPFFEQNSTADSANTETATSKPKSMVDENQPTTTAPANNALVNSTCSNMISDGDLNKLRKKIITQTDQDAILQTVKKSLKNKCITTAQVKDLGNLFLNDENRYGFYDVVYPFVYDYGNYASLQNTLIAPYYKSRFKALLR
jgi:hypothetical protein